MEPRCIDSARFEGQTLLASQQVTRAHAFLLFFVKHDQHVCKIFLRFFDVGEDFLAILLAAGINFGLFQYEFPLEKSDLFMGLLELCLQNFDFLAHVYVFVLEFKFAIWTNDEFLRV